MSSVVQISDESAALSRAAKLLAGISDGKLLKKAIISAVNRAAQSGKTQAGRYAAGEYTIKKSVFMASVQSSVKIVSGGGNDYGVSVRFAGGVIPLIHFSTKFLKNGGVTAAVRRGSGGEIAHAFIAPVFGNLGVFEHVFGTTGPVEQKYGPSAAHMMMDENVVKLMDQTVRETFEKRMDHEVERVLNGWGM